jgi:hypothetical protein
MVCAGTTSLYLPLHHFPLRYLWYSIFWVVLKLHMQKEGNNVIDCYTLLHLYVTIITSSFGFHGHHITTNDPNSTDTDTQPCLHESRNDYTFLKYKLLKLMIGTLLYFKYTYTVWKCLDLSPLKKLMTQFPRTAFSTCLLWAFNVVSTDTVLVTFSPNSNLMSSLLAYNYGVKFVTSQPNQQPLRCSCRVILYKLRGPQLIKKFPAFYGTRRFITAFTTDCHFSLFRNRQVQSTFFHPILEDPFLYRLPIWA